MTSIVGKFFKHYKGNSYFVINISKHTETEEYLVNYISLYDTPKYAFGSLWSRPLNMWNENGRFVEIQPEKELYDKTCEFLNCSSNGIIPNIKKLSPT